MGATATTGVGVQASTPQVPTTKGAMTRGLVLTVSEIGRVRLLFPLIKVTAVDMVLCQILISQILLRVKHESGAVVLPMHLRVQKPVIRSDD